MGWRKNRMLTAYFKECEVCGTLFKTTPSSLQQYCCSNKCRDIRRRKIRIKSHCKICGKEIEYICSRNKVYCSTYCKIEGLAIRKRKEYENKGLYNQFRNGKALKKYLIEKYHKCFFCGWDINTEILEMHHKDRNRRNNLLENVLLVCPNCHTLEHYNNKDGQFKNNKGLNSATH